MVFLRPFLWPGFDVTRVFLGVLVLREIAKSSVKNQARLRRKLCWHKIDPRICESKKFCDVWCLIIITFSGEKKQPGFFHRNFDVGFHSSLFTTFVGWMHNSTFHVSLVFSIPKGCHTGFSKPQHRLLGGSPLRISETSSVGIERQHGLIFTVVFSEKTFDALLSLLQIYMQICVYNYMYIHILLKNTVWSWKEKRLLFWFLN